MKVALSEKAPCPQCGKDLSFDTTASKPFVCDNGHSFTDLNQQTEEQPPTVTMEPPPITEKAEPEPQTVVVSAAAPAETIPVRKQQAPQQQADQNGNKWVDLPNGDALVTIRINDQHASYLKSMVNAGGWEGGDHLAYFVNRLTEGFDSNWFWIFFVLFVAPRLISA